MFSQEFCWKFEEEKMLSWCTCGQSESLNPAEMKVSSSAIHDVILVLCPVLVLYASSHVWCLHVYFKENYFYN